MNLRTTLIVWFANGGFREYVVSVQRDLALLEHALKLVHPSIEVESAPDRDAIVLTGRVPNAVVAQTAEAIARNYLDAASRRGAAQPLVASPTATTDAAAAAAPPTQPAAPAANVRLQGAGQTSGTIINLIELETLPPTPEQKIQAAIQAIGGQGVTVRRVLRGNVRDDSIDTLVLEEGRTISGAGAGATATLLTSGSRLDQLPGMSVDRKGLDTQRDSRATVSIG